MISLIVAMGLNRVIGRNNQLVWHLPADLRHFKKTTIGKPVIMGRKTYESVGKSLPGRTTVVVTRRADFVAPGCLVARSLEQALEAASSEPEILIAGGGDIYRQAIPLCDRMYITIIEQEFEGDTFFPEFDPHEWIIEDERRHDPDERNKYPMIFRTYRRV
jgi:dihydrofolate reductase